MHLIYTLNRDKSIPIKALCAYFFIESSSYYHKRNAKERPKYLIDLKMKQEINEIFYEHEERLGYRALTNQYNAKFNTKYNRKRILRLMQEMGLQTRVKCVRRKKAGPREEVSLNILSRDFSTTAPNQKWVTDTTQMNIYNTKIYFCVVLDLNTREIIGYKIGFKENKKFVGEVLKQALKQTQGEQNIIIHSDQGSVFTSYSYNRLIKKHNHIPSNSRPGNCWHNAMAENFFSRFKSELIHLKKFTSVKHLIKEIENYVTYYNTKRIQNNTKLTPEQIRNNYYQNQNILKTNLNINLNLN